MKRVIKSLGKYKSSLVGLSHRIRYRDPQAYFSNLFDKYRNELNKIDSILKYSEAAVGLSPEDQEEQALPGFSKYMNTGYYKYMLGRYIYSIKYVKNKCVLDTGCGFGWGSYLISDYPRKIISIDINDNALNFAREKWKDRKLNFLRHSVLDLDSLNGNFDVILGFELIEHLTFSAGKRYFEQVFDNLNKKGIVILSSLFPDSEKEAKMAEKRNKYHLKIFTKSEIKAIVRKIGFRKINFIGNVVVVIKK